MFVRRKINRSGSISISVVDKSRGRYEVVRSFGAAKTAAEADLLENRAREFVREQTGEPETLFDKMDEAQLRDYAATLEQGRIELAGPELFFGPVFDRLGLGTGRDPLFRHLVLCRLFDPGSKRRTADYVRRYLGQEIDDARIYRCVDSLRLSDFLLGTEEEAARAGCFLFPLETVAADAADGSLPARPKGRKPRLPRLQAALMVSDQDRPLACRMIARDLPEEKLYQTLRRFFKKCRVSEPSVVFDEDPFLPQIFQMNEMDLDIRPFHRRVKGRIEGHLCICLAAYAIRREVEQMIRDRMARFSFDQVCEAARTMYRLNYISPYTRRPKSVLIQPTPLQKQLLESCY